MEAFEIVQIFALLFWSFQLVPQCYSNYISHNTGSLSSHMMLCWSLGSLCTALYCISAKFSILFIIQPNLFLVFGVTCWTQCYYYNKQHERYGLLYGIALLSLICLTEVIGALYLLKSNFNVTDWPYILLGSMSSSLFGIGFIPQYYMFYIQKKVEGISLLFLLIDMTGSVLSIVSLALQHNFEPISASCYVVVFVCDFIIVLLSLILPAASPNDDECDVSSEMNTVKEGEHSLQQQRSLKSVVDDNI